MEFRELLEMEKMQSISTLKLVDWLEFKANYISILAISWRVKLAENIGLFIIQLLELRTSNP